MNQVIIFDTTLRDGEQSPGASLNHEEKLIIAEQLARLQVDVIEAGFPIASDGDFRAVREIAQKVCGPTIAALARAIQKDIDRAWEAIQAAQKPRIHTFIATSDIHLQYKLKKSRQEVLQQAVEAVRYARKYVSDVEFSAEDAFRSNRDYLCQVVSEVIKAGATTVNIPDTVGYAIPSEFGNLIAYLFEHVPNIADAVISVHCHNDLGLAVANSLAAVQNGARQVECTINGLGERAGNAALEEVVMALATRRALFGVTTGIKTEEIMKTSRLVSHLTGMIVQKNKAIVGENAFAHESGIHQDGFLKEKSTYEIMTPESIGLKESKLVLGKHSGRHAFSERLKELGYNLAPEELEKVFIKFKDLADKKKEIFDEDLRLLVEEGLQQIPETYTLEYIQISSGDKTIPTSTVGLRRADGEVFLEASYGDGPVDATYKCIDQITGMSGKLLSYSIQSATVGKDALGNVYIQVQFDDQIITGRSSSSDIIIASANAYLNAINKALYINGREKKKEKDEVLCQ
ncbi:MAG: 2-isopropylmalate synthase [bacterium]|nr:2-isopropylmalate synthase [bacterium]